MPDHKAALRLVLDNLMDDQRGVLSSLDEIAAVGHRILHGKDAFKQSAIIDQEALCKLKSFMEFGPLHMPANIMGIESCMSLMEGIPQVGVFDTAFHQTMPKKAFLYAIPYELYEEHGVRRYGFHGTSHRYVSQRTAEILGKPLSDLKMVTLHLGNGSSAAAIKEGKVVDTSMGFTPLEGFVMGTRCGDIDPAVVPCLQQKLGMTSQEIDTFMNRSCGLLGLSGVSSDMRDIQRAIEEGNQRAKDAYDVFIYRLVKYVGAYFAAMGGLDVLVFTAGIGENDHLVRQHVCEGLGPLASRWMPVELGREIKRSTYPALIREFRACGCASERRTHDARHLRAREGHRDPSVCVMMATSCDAEAGVHQSAHDSVKRRRWYPFAPRRCFIVPLAS